MPERRVVRLRTILPTDGRSEFVFKSYATSIPGIIQACSESRFIGLQMMTPCFESKYTACAGLVTYVNCALDTVAIPMNTAKSITSSTEPKIVATREKIRHVICYTSTFRLAAFAAELFAHFVVDNLKAWKSVETWSFPGVWDDRSDKPRITDWVCLELRRPHDSDSAKRCTSRIKRGVRRALKNARLRMNAMNRAAIAGLRIKFTDKPSPIWYARVPKPVNTLEW